MTEPNEPSAATGRRPGLWQRAWRAVAALAHAVSAAPAPATPSQASSARLRRRPLVRAKIDLPAPTPAPRPLRAQPRVETAAARPPRSLDGLPWWLQDYL